MPAKKAFSARKRKGKATKDARKRSEEKDKKRDAEATRLWLAALLASRVI